MTSTRPHIAGRTITFLIGAALPTGATAPEEACVCVSVSTGADPQAPSTCRPDGGSAPLARAWEHLRLSFYTLPPRAGTVACIFGRGLTQTQRSSLRAGSTCISQSSAGPIDSAGDGIKMGTSGLLCEDCFPKMSLSTRRHCAPGLQFALLSHTLFSSLLHRI